MQGHKSNNGGEPRNRKEGGKGCEEMCKTMRARCADQGTSINWSVMMKSMFDNKKTSCCRAGKPSGED